MSVRHCQAAVSSAEFSEWQAWLRIHPPEEDRADIRHAQLMALLANVNRDPKRTSRPYDPEDFLLRWTPAALPTPDALYAKVVMLNAAFGGRVN